MFKFVEFFMLDTRKDKIVGQTNQRCRLDPRLLLCKFFFFSVRLILLKALRD